VENLNEKLAQKFHLLIDGLLTSKISPISKKPNKTLKKLSPNLSRNPKKKPIFRNKKLFHIFFSHYL
jgi:hypothetical protein